MSKLPALTGKKLVSALKKIGPGLLSKILRDVEITREALIKLL